MQLIVSGASNTNGPWPTWSDIVQQRYRADCVNVGKKGLGNEAIILRALNSAWQNQSRGEVFIVIMLTSIDKWDWYVDDPTLLSRFAKEKHNVTRLTESAPGGFWCTGSWFPLDKQFFKDNYYSQDYFVLHSLQLISTFKYICQQQGWRYHIMFDSPVWSMTEQQLNLQMPIRNDHCLIKTELCNWVYHSARIGDNIYEPGLIGFLDHIGYQWFSNKFGAHPGPRAHLLFAQSHLYHKLDLVFERLHGDEHIEKIIDRMDHLWTQ